MIKLLRASAGSGKTYRLTKIYIGLLLRSTEPFAYRHILAVTFTNKATAEMKSRILRELDTLAHNSEASPYYEEFRKEFGSDLPSRAKTLLTQILHDYGAFSISTIDSFFQLTLRAFAREIGQFASYQVELDKNSLVHESVDRILNSLSEGDEGLLGWLTQNAIDRLNQDGKFSLEYGLYNAAETLKSDGYRGALERHGLSPMGMYSKERLDRVKAGCSARIKKYGESVRKAANDLDEAFKAVAVLPSETNRKFAEALINKYCNLVSTEEIEKPTSDRLDKCKDPSKWFTGKKKDTYLTKSVQKVLEQPFTDFAALFEEEFKAYRTARIIKKGLRNLVIAERFFNEFEVLMKEKNVLAIDESNTLLKKIIDGSDAPFVYEKLGVRFEHFLLDEFQDTSIIQWQNFEPLLRESNSNNYDNLVVGDVKQSIYRWRGSDWNLLASGVKDSFGGDVDSGETLEENWRSTRTVVSFNNKFFNFAATMLDTQLAFDAGESIVSIYSDVEQVPKSKDEQEGSVELTWCPAASGEEDPVPQAVLESILKAHVAGAQYSQVAVLVRKKEKGASLATFLSENNIPVISDEALSVKSSLTVRRLTSLLAFFDGTAQDRSVNAFLASLMGIEGKRQYYSLTDLCESLLRDIRAKDPEAYDKETLYIQSFMDELKDWTATGGNNLSAFLRHWQDCEKSITSPVDAEAVRILTMHKAKGLEFPYVILPYPEDTGLYFSGTKGWCSLPESAPTIFPEQNSYLWEVGLSSGGESKDTLFSENYKRECWLQYIDNINVFYVAMTRASKALHVISSLKAIESYREGEREGAAYKNFSEILYSFASSGLDSEGHAFYGSAYDFACLLGGTKETPITLSSSSYESFPLNPPGEQRLKLRADASDFFDDEGHTGYEASRRIRGTVLHDILSEVVVPSDLPDAVRKAVAAGRLSGEEATEAEGLLKGAIESVSDRGWFPSSREGVRNEEAIITSSGEVRRPDRVVDLADRTVIIDYKFGHPERAYYTQLREYASLYSQMFPSRPVEAWLWYLTEPDPSKSCVQVIS